jgi:hypothetical protein
MRGSNMCNAKNTVGPLTINLQAFVSKLVNPVQKKCEGGGKRLGDSESIWFKLFTKDRRSLFVYLTILYAGNWIGPPSIVNSTFLDFPKKYLDWEEGERERVQAFHDASFQVYIYMYSLPVSRNRAFRSTGATPPLVADSDVRICSIASGICIIKINNQKYKVQFTISYYSDSLK